jgi:non-specific serine/threonine protein kinase/serine/threonine-protein kinase
MSFDKKQALEIVDKALEIPQDERPAYLDSACQDSSLRQYVESLLASSQQADDFLRDPVLMTHASVLEPGPVDSWLGRRLGPYQLIEEIGRGGMGAVYRAVRADDQYQKQVAIKLVRTGFETRFAQTRFRSERQILATLEHPNIARLLDGGTADDRSPYFVMELVEGIPIHEYCDDHKLSITERLRLFRTICSAIQYAHQSLVVHRDLKPANILVTSEGVPKLLDFGIAKILDANALAGEVEPTIDFLRMLTPEYASPEQVRGEAISTASDVYSLGVILYLLLTGHRPYKVDGLSTEAMRRVVCETVPARPSVAVGLPVSANRRDGSSEVTLTPEGVSAVRNSKPAKLSGALAGDLDNIVLKSLHKEPGRRYSSVEQLSEDIRRYIEGLPVGARPDTLIYRAGKFVKRNKVPVAAGALLLLSLCGGLAATLWEAHLTRVERAKAERRFNDVREVANSLVFEIHDAIKDLPGSTSVRKLLVDRSLRYLDNLSREASGDTSLQRELAAAYEKVGDVQGSPYHANLGDTPGALASYRKAGLILATLSRSDPENVSLKWERYSNYLAIAACLSATHDFPEALTNVRKALQISESLLSKSTDPGTQDRAADAHQYLGFLLRWTGDFSGSLQSFRRAVAIRISVQDTKGPQGASIRKHLSQDYAAITMLLASQGQLGAAIDAVRQATKLLEDLSAEDPTNGEIRGFLADSYQWLGADLKDTGDLTHGLRYLRKARAIYQILLQADPQDAWLPYRLGYVDIRISELQFTVGNAAKGLGSLRESLAIFQKLVQTHPDNNDNRNGLSDSYAAFGAEYRQMAVQTDSSKSKRLEDWRAARTYYEKSLDVLVDVRDRGVLSTEERQKMIDIQQNIAVCDAAISRYQAIGKVRNGAHR